MILKYPTMQSNMTEEYWRSYMMQTTTTAVCNLNMMCTEENLKTDKYRLTDVHKLDANVKRWVNDWMSS